MKKIMKYFFSKDSDIRWILSGFYNKPLVFFSVLVKSLLATYKLTGTFLPVRVRVNVGQKVKIKTSKNNTVILEGIINFKTWIGEDNTSSLILLEGASLKVLGDMSIGPGVHIFVSQDAELEFGGAKKSSDSGITSNTRIMVSKNIRIGFDTIIAWGVYITDSDWHKVRGKDRVKPVMIGDNVWIAHDVSILKGVKIPNGCVVGAKSLVSDRNYEENSLLVGVPAVMEKKNIQWRS